MKEKLHKTNAARHLDTLGIPYELISYPVDEDDLGAQHVAAVTGQNLAQIYKTLVLRGERTGYFVCVIPGAAELDLKLAAKAAGDKSCQMLHVKELFPLTGYLRGGCSPLGMKKLFPTFIHEDCILWDYIFVSAGLRGLQIKINPQDLLKAVPAQTAPLCADGY
ncbi:Cys-tRNA(Pro) deacylase [Candidatus Avelusimicrobium faecicola]|uniref:Cys-tRNA(Pro) deacylase n=1 Tax=Candidatus Avelusimicrobium faecicola TaxID=3416205 RepID=UPI003D0C8D88